MTSVLIVDSNNEIVSAAGPALNGALVCDNEIHLLNEIERGGFAVVLLHYAVRGWDSAEFVEQVKTTNPAVEIVLLGNDLDEELVMDCVMAGANGYQHLSSLAVYANKMIRVIGAGEAWISRKMVARLIECWRVAA